MVDDEELDRDQDEEDHHADDEVAADDELTERHDDVAGRLDAVRPVQQDQPRAGDVQRQPQQRQDQQQRREDRELDGFLDVDGGQQQDHRQADVDRQQQIEQQRRQRHDHQPDDRDDGAGREEMRRALAAGGRSPCRCCGLRHIRAPVASGGSGTPALRRLPRRARQVSRRRLPPRRRERARASRSRPSGCRDRVRSP